MHLPLRFLAEQHWGDFSRFRFPGALHPQNSLVDWGCFPESWDHPFGSRGHKLQEAGLGTPLLTLCGWALHLVLYAEFPPSLLSHPLITGWVSREPLTPLSDVMKTFPWAVCLPRAERTLFSECLVMFWINDAPWKYTAAFSVRSVRYTRSPSSPRNLPYGVFFTYNVQSVVF